jgi:hypothetical protein
MKSGVKRSKNMYYPVGPEFYIMIFFGLVFGLPAMLFGKAIIEGLKWWQDERKAARYIKKIMGE